jgi:acetylornithine/N-succinyldiaminopimelate aminotransferase
MPTSHVMNTYGRQPVTFSHGKGVWIWDEAGRKYLDAMAGIAVSGLGHAHPKLTTALTDQLGKLIHTSNLYGVRNQETLADRICALSGMEEVFFCSSGSEANETAIKLARYHAHNNGNNNAAIIVMERAWHGRTLATLSATGNRKAQAGFEPLVPGFVRVPYNDVQAVKQAADANPNVAAILVEVLQGEGGIHVADVEYVRFLRQICDEKGWLLMLDEVQCGIGRTGKWFGFQHSGILCDVMTLAKGLGSGVPIGACVAAGKGAHVLKPGTHGSTFGGGPFACRAGIATLAAMEDENLLANATKMGEVIRNGFREALRGTPGFVETRGMGLMIGVELDRPCGDLTNLALEAGVLINVTADRVIRLLPPLIINEAESRELVARLSPVIKKFLSK